MEEQSTPILSQAAKRWNPFQRAGNPVILKELRGRMRGRQAVVLLTGYLALIGLIVGIIYMTLAAQSYSPYSPNPEYRQTIGKAIFSVVVMMELFMVSLIGPSLTAGAIASERERQTLEILRTTALSARSLVLGKLGASLAYLLLLIIAVVPIEGIAFFLGGVGLEEVLVSSLMLVVTAIFYCSLGLYFSSFMKRASGANVASYVTIVLSYIVIALIFYGLTMAETALNRSNGTSAVALNTFLGIVLWILVSINPLLSAAVSETILVGEQSLWTTTTTLFGNQTMTLPSPWITYTLIYILLSLLMIALSIRFVNRPEK